MLSDPTFRFARTLAAPAEVPVRPDIPKRIYGRSWSEDIYGTSGIDWIYGANGDDFIIGLDGSDKLYGGVGNDWIWGGEGHDVLYGDAGNDVLRGENGNDVLYGGNDDNTLYGGAGSDRLFGSWNNDRLYGNSENDILSGHTGNDRLSGGAGHDILSTGEGYDTVNFDTMLDTEANVDRITDFNPWADRINLKQSVFIGLSQKGKLSEAAFVVGGRAQDANDRIIYDKNGGGALYFDPDGKGGEPQLIFARVGVIELSHAGFWVV